MVELEINKNILLHIHKIGRKDVREYMESNIPEIFDEPFINIGVVLKRRNYPDGFYALYKRGSEIVLLNITTGKEWLPKINVGSIKDPNYIYLTRKEFSNMVCGAGSSVDEWEVVK